MYIPLAPNRSLHSPLESKSLRLGFGHQFISLWRRGRGGHVSTAGAGAPGAHAAHGGHGHGRHHAVGIAHVGHTHAWTVRIPPRNMGFSW